MAADFDPAMAMIDALIAERIPYMLVGSYSSNLYGVPRLTKDADFVIEAAGRSIVALQQHLPAPMKLDPQIAFEGVTGTLKNIVKVTDSPFVVELFRLSDDPHDRARFERRRIAHLWNRDVIFPTAEDVIVTKLRWARGKDRDDIANILAVQGDAIDFGYVYRWCAEHGTRDTLDAIRASIPPID